MAPLGIVGAMYTVPVACLRQCVAGRGTSPLYP